MGCFSASFPGAVISLIKIVQYMYDLRVSYGVRFNFGILTTYEKWRFFWFKDSDAAMKETSIKLFEEMNCNTPLNQSGDSTRLADVPYTIDVYKSKVYCKSDKDLVLMIRTVLYKWSLVARDQIPGYLSPNRQYQTGTFGSNDRMFSKLEQIDKFTYRYIGKFKINSLFTRIPSSCHKWYR
jgi:hypothetical protein